MRRLSFALLLLALLLPATAFAKPTLPDIEDEVMCISCGTVLNVSQAPSADQTRRLISDLIDQGLTKQEIKDELVAQFGRNVLATPDTDGTGISVYLIPLFLALLAIGAVALTARRWRRVGTTLPPEREDMPEEDAERLERDMAGYDR